MVDGMGWDGMRVVVGLLLGLFTVLNLANGSMVS